MKNIGIKSLCVGSAITHIELAKGLCGREEMRTHYVLALCCSLCVSHVFQAENLGAICISSV